MQLQQNDPCPNCHSKFTVKNGKTYYGNRMAAPQNFKCKQCKRQFVERMNDPKQDYKEKLLPMLLLERISLRGISRVLQQSLSWIYKRMEALWKRMPDELPIRQLTDPAIDLHCLEADELWSFVGAKDCKEWVWLAIERNTRLIVGYHIGGRDEQGALGLKLSIDSDLLKRSLVFADDFPSYKIVFEKGQLEQDGKRQTTKIEPFNNTIRQRCSRLVRLGLSFSKKWENHYLAIKYFIINYNIEILAKKSSL